MAVVRKVLCLSNANTSLMHTIFRRIVNKKLKQIHTEIESHYLPFINAIEKFKEKEKKHVQLSNVEQSSFHHPNENG